MELNLRLILICQTNVKEASLIYAIGKNIYYHDKYVYWLRITNLLNKLKLQCLFPEYFVETIKTPLFILNSAFDNFQVILLLLLLNNLVT